MLILSLDSASSACSACVWRDGKVLAQVLEPMERGQDQRMMPLLIDLMKQASVSFDDLDRIAVTRGPGSFTGLRIGLAAARGIGLAADKPVIGVDRFAIFREQVQQPGKKLLVVINSKRKELFIQFYATDNSISSPAMMTQEEILDFLKLNPDTVVAGDAIDTALPGFVKTTQLEAVTGALLASRTAVGDLAYLPRPLYIRAPDVTIKPVPVEACHD